MYGDRIESSLVIRIGPTFYRKEEDRYIVYTFESLLISTLFIDSTLKYEEQRATA